jgi:hypothetical protein
LPLASSTIAHFPDRRPREEPALECCSRGRGPGTFALLSNQCRVSITPRKSLGPRFRGNDDSFFRSSGNSAALIPRRKSTPPGAPLKIGHLGIAIVAEVIATSALKASEGFTGPLPSLAVALGHGVAFCFLWLGS